MSKTDREICSAYAHQLQDSGLVPEFSFAVTAVNAEKANRSAVCGILSVVNS